MTRTIIHRHRFSAAEIVDALGLGQDCLAYQVAMDHGQIVVDIVEPGMSPPEQPPSPEVSGQKPGRAAQALAGEKPDFPADEQSGKTSPDPELKGGPLATRASICCGEPGFRTFLGVKTADEAKADVCRRCGIDSRRLLDHDEAAAAVWRDIDGKYRLWLEGLDVEI